MSGLINLVRVHRYCYRFECGILRYINSVRDVVFNAAFINVSVISWRSVLTEEETEVPGENNRPVASH